MLKLNNINKESSDAKLKDISLEIMPGKQVSIECSQAVSNLLVNIVLKKVEFSRGSIEAGDIHVIYDDETYYEYMRVKDYLNFFRKIYEKGSTVDEVMMHMGLRDLANLRIKKLTLCQKRRLSYARELLSFPDVLIIQEPLHNLDRESFTLVMQALLIMRNANVAILNTSTKLKDVLLTGDQVYRIDEDGITAFKSVADRRIQEINLLHEKVLLDNESEQEIDSNKLNEFKQFKINKIQAKLEDRILLIDPNEIDYIEVVQGVCQLSVKGERFNCPNSLSELEERLLHMGFFRSHRSYIVNLQRVCEVLTWSRNSYSLGLDDKSKSIVPLSKGRLPELKKILSI